MGLITGNFEKFIEFSNSIPVLEHILDKNKFIYFLNETLCSGILPILSSEEVIGIKSFLTICPIIKLTELKKNVLKDITNTDRSFPTKYQAESYLESLELELAPILYAFGQLNLIDEIREKDLYPIPLSLISGRNDSDEKGNAIIEKVKELNVTPLAKMKAYTSVEKRNYHLLYSLFSYNMDCYNEYREVMLEIEDIKERRGIGVIPKREIKYCIPLKTITELHSTLNGVIIESIDCADFMKCFDVNNKPQIALRYINRNQNLMTYALSLILGVNKKVALSNFGIKNFDQMKGKKLPKAKRVLENRINIIIGKNPIIVSLK